jgi:hypothetical protein
MQFTKSHAVQVALAAALIALTWVVVNVTINSGVVQIAGLPPAIVGVLASALQLAKLAVGLFSSSVSNATNTAAAVKSGSMRPPPGLAMLTLAFVGLLGIAACSQLQASNVPADVKNDFDCAAAQLVAGVTDPVSIEATCLPGQLATVVDFVEALVGSPTFVAAHPNVSVSQVQVGLAGARAKLSAHPQSSLYSRRQIAAMMNAPAAF